MNPLIITTDTLQLMQALTSRKRTFLEKEEWIIIPFHKHPESKTPIQKLLDIVCPLPGLMEDYHLAKAQTLNEEDLGRLCQPILVKVKDMLKKAFRWRWEWERAYDSPVAWEVTVDPKTSWTVDDELEPLFPTVIYFKSLDFANEISHYNALVTTLQATGYAISRGPSHVAGWAFSELPFNEQPGKKNPLNMPTGDIDTYLDCSKDSMRCVDYFLQEQHRNLGAYSLLYPLRMW